MQLGTAVSLPRDIDADLDRWLEPFLDAAGRSTRRKMAPLYLRGLLGSGGRKSVQPMAERLGLSGHDQLHHFVSSPAWDDAPLWRVLAEQVDRQVGGEGAVLVVDDTGLPQEGRALGRGGAATLRRVGQGGELSGAGLADAGARRGAAAGRAAAVPAARLDG